jgi:hypothetical protein
MRQFHLDNSNAQKLFGVLDLLLFIRFANQLRMDFLQSELLFWAIAVEVARPIIICTFLFSGVGLILRKRWACLLSLIQFPFRLFFLFLTFGLLTWLSRPFGGILVYQALLLAAVVLEFLRFAMTWVYWRGITIKATGGPTASSPGAF